VIDRASFERSREPSAGIAHVMIVAGTFVVRDEAPVEGAFPGGAILAGATAGRPEAPR
jgi:hypothetical protein